MDDINRKGGGWVNCPFFLFLGTVVFELEYSRKMAKIMPKMYDRGGQTDVGLALTPRSAKVTTRRST
jgi:hypothetical protein